MAAGDNQEDLDALASIASDLADAVERVLPGWVGRSVERVVLAAGRAVDAELRTAIDDAGGRAVTEVGAALRDLLATDVDEQRTNPLAVLRAAVRYPTEVLAKAGIPPVVRGEFEQRAFPDDVYGLAPATWSDVDDALQEPGIVWGAAKAHIVLTRRRREGKA